MKKLERISTKILRWAYLILTTIVFVAALIIYNWLYYGKSMLFWLPAVLVLLVTALLAYLVKRQLEARLEPLLIFNTLQQIIGVLIALAVGLFALAYKALNTKINDGNEVYWILFAAILLIFSWNAVELYKELKRRSKNK